MRKINKQVTAMWVDETISDEAMTLLDNIAINRDIFISKVGILIGRYRSSKEFYSSEPAPQETIKHLEKIINQIDALIENIKLNPADVGAWQHEAMWKLHKENEFSYSDYKAQEYLTTLKIGYLYTINKIQNYPRKIGREKNQLENNLIYEIFLLINECKTEKILLNIKYEFISNFLIFNKISEKAEIETIRKIINNQKKSRNSLL